VRLARRIERGALSSVAVGPGAILLAVLVGAWLGHALEYVRVWGTRDFGGVVSRSLHAYMGPVGLVLLLAGVVATASTSLVAAELELSLARLRRALLTGRGEGEPDEALPAPTIVRFATLAGLLWLSQVPIYLIQENIEARVAHLPPPGWGALSGRHVLAPLVHLAVAVAVAGVLYLTRRRVTHLARRVREVAALLASFPRPVASVSGLRAGVRWWTPAERWGKQSWCRPPPVLVAPR
jgi:hypothetical protein